MLLVLSLAIASLLPGLHAFSDYFEGQPEDAQLDRWMEEQMGQSQGMLPKYPMEDEVGHAYPSHMEEHDFMTAFFQNQEDEDSFGEYTEMEEDNSDGNVENYMADFFGHTPDTGAQNYFEGGAEGPVDSMSEQDNYLNNQDANEMDNKPYISEEEEEEEDEGYYPGGENAAQFQFYGREDDSEPMSPFHEFPDDDLFAEVQDTGDADCEQYKKRVTLAQTKLNEEGRVLQKNINATEKQIEVYEAVQNKKCQRNCETVCIPSDVGEECLEKKNGTCTARQPKIDECARRIPDPECKAKEADCEGSKKEAAEKTEKLEKEKEAIHADLKKLEDNLLKVVEGIPEKCKSMRI